MSRVSSFLEDVTRYRPLPGPPLHTTYSTPRWNSSPCAAVTFAGMRSTFVSSSVPIFGGVMRHSPLPSWSLAMTRPLSSIVMLTHEPSSAFGTVNSFSTWNPGSVTNVFAGTLELPAAPAAASNTLPHGWSPYLATTLAGTPFSSPRLAFAVQVASVTAEMSSLSVSSCRTNPAFPPSFSTTASRTFSPATRCFVMSASTGCCHSVECATCLPFANRVNTLSHDARTRASFAPPVLNAFARV